MCEQQYANVLTISARMSSMIKLQFKKSEIDTKIQYSSVLCVYWALLSWHIDSDNLHFNSFVLWRWCGLRSRSGRSPGGVLVVEVWVCENAQMIVKTEMKLFRVIALDTDLLFQLLSRCKLIYLSFCTCLCVLLAAASKGRSEELILEFSPSFQISRLKKIASTLVFESKVTVFNHLGWLNPPLASQRRPSFWTLFSSRRVLAAAFVSTPANGPVDPASDEFLH